MPAAPLIAYTNVGKTFDSGRVVAVDDVSLEVAEGEFLLSQDAGLPAWRSHVRIVVLPDMVVDEPVSDRSQNGAGSLGHVCGRLADNAAGAVEKHGLARLKPAQPKSCIRPRAFYRLSPVTLEAAEDWDRSECLPRP